MKEFLLGLGVGLVGGALVYAGMIEYLAENGEVIYEVDDVEYRKCIDPKGGHTYASARKKVIENNSEE